MNSLLGGLDQILQQASTAMLAQANASKQNVLSLLQGQGFKPKIFSNWSFLNMK